MPSIITQNIGAAAAQQVRSPEPVAAVPQQSTTQDRSQLLNSSRISAEHATVAPDGGAKTRATDGGKRRVHSTFESREQDREGDEASKGDGMEQGHPSSGVRDTGFRGGRNAQSGSFTSLHHQNG